MNRRSVAAACASSVGPIYRQMTVKNVFKKSTSIGGQHVISARYDCYQAAALQETNPLLESKRLVDLWVSRLCCIIYFRGDIRLDAALAIRLRQQLQLATEHHVIISFMRKLNIER